MILQTGEVFSTKESEFVLKADLSFKILTVTILTVKDDGINECQSKGCRMISDQ